MYASKELLVAGVRLTGSWAGTGVAQLVSLSRLWPCLHQGLDWSCLSQGSNCQRDHLVWFLVTNSKEQKSLWEEIASSAAAARKSNSKLTSCEPKGEACSEQAPGKAG